MVAFVLQIWIMIRVHMLVKLALSLIELLLALRTLPALHSNLVCIFMVLLIMTTKSKVRSSNIRTIWFRTANSIGLFLHLLISCHVIEPRLIMIRVLNCVFMKVLGHIWLAMVNLWTTLTFTPILGGLLFLLLGRFGWCFSYSMVFKFERAVASGFVV